MPPTSQGVGGPSLINPASPVNLREDLLARAVTLFGKAEVMPYEVSRFPDIFQKTLERLKTTCRNEIVGVECNTTSNLCALVCAYEDADKIRTFINENPCVAHTAWTTWRSYIFIWANVTGWRPQNCILPGCLWISDGILPAVEVAGSDHYPNGFPDTEYGSAIKSVKFSDFKWHPNLHEEFMLLRLENESGPLLQVVDQRPVLNLITASRFVITRLGLRYFYQTDSFTMVDGDGNRTSLSTNSLTKVIEDWLVKRSAKVGISASPERMVSNVIAAILKQIAIGPEEGLRRYLNECVERRIGTSVTMAELLAGYQAHCDALGAARMPPRTFYQAVTVSVKQRFGVAKSHDIGRRSPGGKETDKSGFRNLSLNGNRLDTSDTSDTSDPLNAS